MTSTANTHRVFVTAESPSSGVAAKGNLSGIVSIVDSKSGSSQLSSPSLPSLRTSPPTFADCLLSFLFRRTVLSLFARVANLPDVDPGKMKRHRRASSVSSQSSDVSGASGSGLSTSAGELGRFGEDFV